MSLISIKSINDFLFAPDTSQSLSQRNENYIDYDLTVKVMMLSGLFVGLSTLPTPLSPFFFSLGMTMAKTTLAMQVGKDAFKKYDNSTKRKSLQQGGGDKLISKYLLYFASFQLVVPALMVSPFIVGAAALLRYTLKDQSYSAMQHPRAPQLEVNKPSKKENFITRWFSRKPSAQKLKRVLT